MSKLGRTSVPDASLVAVGCHEAREALSDLPQLYRKKARPVAGRAFHRKELERWVIGVAFGAFCIEQLRTRFVERGVLA